MSYVADRVKKLEARSAKKQAIIRKIRNLVIKHNLSGTDAGREILRTAAKA